MKDEHEKTLQAVLATLNSIPVFGKKNLDMLLACIMAIEGIIAAEEESKDA